jgi:hypothetical protein
MAVDALSLHVRGAEEWMPDQRRASTLSWIA